MTIIPKGHEAWNESANQSSTKLYDSQTKIDTNAGRASTSLGGSRSVGRRGMMQRRGQSNQKKQTLMGDSASTFNHTTVFDRSKSSMGSAMDGRANAYRTTHHYIQHGS